MSMVEVVLVVPVDLAGDCDCSAKLLVERKSGFEFTDDESQDGAAPAPYHRLWEPLTFVDPLST